MHVYLPNDPFCHIHEYVSNSSYIQHITVWKLTWLTFLLILYIMIYAVIPTPVWIHWLAVIIFHLFPWYAERQMLPIFLIFMGVYEMTGAIAPWWAHRYISSRRNEVIMLSDILAILRARSRRVWWVARFLADIACMSVIKRSACRLPASSTAESPTAGR